jgi:hypothetical protein
MVRLGGALLAQSARDGRPARPGSLLDRLAGGGSTSEVSASALLRDLLATMAPVWRSGVTILGQPAGDVWPHHWAGDAIDSEGHRHAESAGWVPFHLLTQWLAYSLVDPLQQAGVAVTGLDALTGLPETRNGGLLIDTGVIVARAPRDLERSWKPGDEFVIEWRALTVVLLDELAALLRERLRARMGEAARALPLAALLEGGTWAAGCEIAAEKRAGGAPPLIVASDGSVF